MLRADLSPVPHSLLHIFSLWQAGVVLSAVLVGGAQAFSNPAGTVGTPWLQDSSEF